MITIIIKEENDAHESLQQWRLNNPDGFVINVRSHNNIMLHRATGCLHLGDENWYQGKEGWGSLGKTTKVCSLNREQLIEWTKDYYKIDLKICKHCNP